MLSILISCWYDQQANSMRMRVVDVSTGQEVHLKDGTFLLRISSDAKSLVERCMIRHLASGNEAYIQGSSHLRKLVTDCLLDSIAPAADDLLPP